MTTNQPDRLDVIETIIEAGNERMTRIEATLEKLVTEQQTTNRKLEEETKRWDERFYQMNRDFGQTSRTIIVTAGTVTILAPVLSALAPAVERIISVLVGQQP